MEPLASRTVLLHAHAPHAVVGVRGIHVHLERLKSGALRLHYEVDPVGASLRIPAPAPSRHEDGLWRHTCFEVFVREPGSMGYVEYNVAPSGAFAVYRFSGYRAGGHSIADPALSIDTATLGGTSLRMSCHPFSMMPGGPRTLAVSAVLEDTEGRLSYWALNHPSDQPDFHHADSFSLTL